MSPDGSFRGRSSERRYQRKQNQERKKERRAKDRHKGKRERIFKLMILRAWTTLKKNDVAPFLSQLLSRSLHLLLETTGRVFRWSEMTKRLREEQNELREHRKQERKGKNCKRSVPFPSFFFSLASFCSSDCDPCASTRQGKVYSNELSHLDSPGNKDVRLHAGGTKRVQLPRSEGARTLKRENGQGCSYRVPPSTPLCSILEDRKSLVIRESRKSSEEDALLLPVSLLFSLSVLISRWPTLNCGSSFYHPS